jgi:hypothetical protein
VKGIAIILCLWFSMACAQDTSATLVKYKVTLTYGIAFMKPDEINDHITISNDEQGSSAKIIESMPEAAITISIRPQWDSQIITARAGYMFITRMYDVNIPETTTSSTIVGRTTGTVKETYTMYPFSLGVGLASRTFGSQLQLEFIYGLGYIDEGQSYVSSTGVETSHSRTLSSSAYGFRLAGNMTVQFSERIGLTLEGNYRYLVFKDYEDQMTGRTEDIKFNTSGLGGAIGLSILF